MNVMVLFYQRVRVQQVFHFFTRAHQNDYDYIPFTSGGKLVQTAYATHLHSEYTNSLKYIVECIAIGRHQHQLTIPCPLQKYPDYVYTLLNTPHQPPPAEPKRQDPNASVQLPQREQPLPPPPSGIVPSASRRQHPYASVHGPQRKKPQPPPPSGIVPSTTPKPEGYSLADQSQTHKGLFQNTLTRLHNQNLPPAAGVPTHQSLFPPTSAANAQSLVDPAFYQSLDFFAETKPVVTPPFFPDSASNVMLPTITEAESASRGLEGIDHLSDESTTVGYNSDKNVSEDEDSEQMSHLNPQATYSESVASRTRWQRSLWKQSQETPLPLDTQESTGEVSVGIQQQKKTRVLDYQSPPKLRRTSSPTTP